MYFEGLKTIYSNGILLSAKVNIALKTNDIVSGIETACKSAKCVV